MKEIGSEQKLKDLTVSKKVQTYTQYPFITLSKAKLLR